MVEDARSSDTTLLLEGRSPPPSALPRELPVSSGWLTALPVVFDMVYNSARSRVGVVLAYSTFCAMLLLLIALNAFGYTPEPDDRALSFAPAPPAEVVLGVALPPVGVRATDKAGRAASVPVEVTLVPVDPSLALRPNSGRPAPGAAVVDCAAPDCRADVPATTPTWTAVTDSATGVATFSRLLLREGHAGRYTLRARRVDGLAAPISHTFSVAAVPFAVAAVEAPGAVLSVGVPFSVTVTVAMDPSVAVAMGQPRPNVSVATATARLIAVSLGQTAPALVAAAPVVFHPGRAQNATVAFRGTVTASAAVELRLGVLLFGVVTLIAPGAATVPGLVPPPPPAPFTLRAPSGDPVSRTVTVAVVAAPASVVEGAVATFTVRVVPAAGTALPQGTAVWAAAALTTAAGPGDPKVLDHGEGGVVSGAGIAALRVVWSTAGAVGVYRTVFRCLGAEAAVAVTVRSSANATLHFNPAALGPVVAVGAPWPAVPTVVVVGPAGLPLEGKVAVLSAIPDGHSGTAVVAAEAVPSSAEGIAGFASVAIAAAAPGRYRLTVSVDGGPVATFALAVRPPPTEQPSVALTACEASNTTPPYDPLAPPCLAAVAPDGSRVPHAALTVTLASGGAEHQSAVTTDGAGELRLPAVLLPGGVVTVAFRARGATAPVASLPLQFANPAAVVDVTAASHSAGARTNVTLRGQLVLPVAPHAHGDPCSLLGVDVAVAAAHPLFVLVFPQGYPALGVEGLGRRCGAALPSAGVVSVLFTARLTVVRPPELPAGVVARVAIGGFGSLVAVDGPPVAATVAVVADRPPAAVLPGEPLPGPTVAVTTLDGRPVAGVRVAAFAIPSGAMDFDSALEASIAAFASPAAFVSAAAVAIAVDGLTAGPPVSAPTNATGAAVLPRLSITSASSGPVALALVAWPAVEGGAAAAAAPLPVRLSAGATTAALTPAAVAIPGGASTTTLVAAATLDGHGPVVGLSVAPVVAVAVPVGYVEGDSSLAQAGWQPLRGPAGAPLFVAREGLVLESLRLPSLSSTVASLEVGTYLPGQATAMNRTALVLRRAPDVVTAEGPATVVVGQTFSVKVVLRGSTGPVPGIAPVVSLRRSTGCPGNASSLSCGLLAYNATLSDSNGIARVTAVLAAGDPALLQGGLRLHVAPPTGPSFLGALAGITAPSAITAPFTVSNVVCRVAVVQPAETVTGGVSGTLDFVAVFRVAPIVAVEDCSGRPVRGVAVVTEAVASPDDPDRAEAFTIDGGDAAQRTTDEHGRVELRGLVNTAGVTKRVVHLRYVAAGVASPPGLPIEAYVAWLRLFSYREMGFLLLFFFLPVFLALLPFTHGAVVTIATVVFAAFLGFVAGWAPAVFNTAEPTTKGLLCFTLALAAGTMAALVAQCGVQLIRCGRHTVRPQSGVGWVLGFLPAAEKDPWLLVAHRYARWVVSARRPQLARAEWEAVTLRDQRRSLFGRAAFALASALTALDRVIRRQLRRCRPRRSSNDSSRESTPSGSPHGSPHGSPRVHEMLRGSGAAARVMSVVTDDCAEPPPLRPMPGLDPRRVPLRFLVAMVLGGVAVVGVALAASSIAASASASLSRVVAALPRPPSLTDAEEDEVNSMLQLGLSQALRALADNPALSAFAAYVPVVQNLNVLAVWRTLLAFAENVESIAEVALFVALIVASGAVLLSGALLWLATRRLQLELRRGGLREHREPGSSVLIMADRYVGCQVMNFVFLFIIVYIAVAVVVAGVSLIPTVAAYFPTLFWKVVTFVAISLWVTAATMFIERLVVNKLFVTGGDTVRHIVPYSTWSGVAIMLGIVNGIMGTVLRFVMASATLLSLFARLDTDIFPRYFLFLDSAYTAYYSMLVVDELYNNPLMLSTAAALAADAIWHRHRRALQVKAPAYGGMVLPATLLEAPDPEGGAEEVTSAGLEAIAAPKRCVHIASMRVLIEMRLRELSGNPPDPCAPLVAPLRAEPLTDDEWDAVLAARRKAARRRLLLLLLLNPSLRRYRKHVIAADAAQRTEWGRRVLEAVTAASPEEEAGDHPDGLALHGVPTPHHTPALGIPSAAPTTPSPL